jgi:type II secretory pathway component PulF
VVILVILACQGRHGEAWRSFMERIFRPIPVLGSARRALALARLSAALEALISAGVTIVEAWQIAVLACGSPALNRAVLNWKPQLLDGHTPAQLLSESREFPEVFCNLYHTGEISGQLDESLRRLHQYYQDEGTRKLRALAQWTPKIVYFTVMLAVAYTIISFWANYYGGIADALNF